MKINFFVGVVGSRWSESMLTPEIECSFVEENNRVITVNWDRYLQIIEKLFMPSLENMDVYNVWLRQDGSAAHTSKIVMLVWRETFPEQLVFSRDDTSGAARLPDWTPCNFLPLSHFKSLVHIISGSRTNQYSGQQYSEAYSEVSEIGY